MADEGIQFFVQYKNIDTYDNILGTGSFFAETGVEFEIPATGVDEEEYICVSPRVFTFEPDPDGTKGDEMIEVTWAGEYDPTIPGTRITTFRNGKWYAL